MLIKTHTVEGQRLLDRVGGFMSEVGLIVRSHHERWDGGGYPDGLAGEAIPLEARIIACCDSWNAMCTDRAYRKALPQDEALAELRLNAGLQFDPRIVEVLLQLLPTTEPVAANGLTKREPSLGSLGGRVRHRLLALESPTGSTPFGQPDTAEESNIRPVYGAIAGSLFLPPEKSHITQETEKGKTGASR
ncbi:MAG: HD-GYP domain-containing protein [Solirubrobacteraceae bacterium]